MKFLTKHKLYLVKVTEFARWFSPCTLMVCTLHTDLQCMISLHIGLLSKVGLHIWFTVHTVIDSISYSAWLVFALAYSARLMCIPSFKAWLTVQ
jgi:hypothetical protein